MIIHIVTKDTHNTPGRSAGKKHKSFHFLVVEEIVE